MPCSSSSRSRASSRACRSAASLSVALASASRPAPRTTSIAASSSACRRSYSRAACWAPVLPEAFPFIPATRRRTSASTACSALSAPIVTRLRAIVKRRAAIERVRLPLLASRPDDHARLARCAAKDAEASEQPFRLRTRATWDVLFLSAVEGGDVDQRRDLTVHEIAEAELTDVDAIAEHRLNAVVAAGDPALAEIVTDSRDRRATRAHPESLSDDARPSASRARAGPCPSPRSA